MRQIKFRAWCQPAEIPCGHMVSWHTIKNNFRQYLGENNGSDTHHKPGKDQYILMQWTGLLDKNGKEIYEGDIIKDIYDDFYGHHEYIGEVEWDDDIRDSEIGYFLGAGLTFYMNGKSNEEVEVIGNVWENGDLLNDNK